MRGGIVRGLVLAAAVLPWAAVAEELGPDGFPLDYRPSDFVVASPTTVSSTHRGTGMLSVPIGQLPTVQADTLTAPVLSSSSVRVELPSATVPAAPQLPVVAVDDVGKVPTDLAALDDWGPLTGMQSRVDEGAWKKVSRTEALAQVAGLGGRSLAASPLVQDLAARLLLTRAAPPKDPSVTAGAWLAGRAAALGALRLDEQAYALWRVVPPLARNADSALARGWAVSSVMAGQTVEPCALARKLVAGTDASGTVSLGPWQELAVVCTALDRVSGGLDLGLSVAGEDNGFDPVLRRLLVAIRDDDAPVKIGPGEKIGDLSAAVLATYPALLEPVALPRLPSVVLRRLVQTTALPLGMRARSAEILQQRNPTAVGAETVRILYEAFTYPPDQVARGLDVAKTLDGVGARSLLWQGARQATVPGDKARAWQAFASRAEADGVGQLPLWLGPSRAGIPAEQDTATLAFAGAREAWLADNAKQARQWQVAASGVDSPTVALVKMRAEMGFQSAVADGKLPDGVFEQWLVAESLGDVNVRRAAARGLAVVDGLGVALPQDAWGRLDKVMAGGAGDDTTGLMGGDVVRSEALASDAEAKRVGPLLARLAGWVAEAPPQAWAPLDAKAAVAALAKVGLTREAKALAWEIMNAPQAAGVKPPEPKAAEAPKAAGVRIQNMQAPARKPEMLPPPEAEPLKKAKAK